MADLGIRVSQAGTDVQAAADYQLLFSSGWPLLKIEHEDTYVITSDTTQTIYTHGLGYIPAFFVEDNTQGYAESTPGLNQAIGTSAGEMKYFGGLVSGLTFPATIHYFIYRLDLTTEYAAPTVLTAPQSVGTVPDDFGVKVSKPGKDVSSKDLRDFTVHSGAQSPLIHQVATTVTNAGATGRAIVSNHNFGYYPLMFPYYESQSGYYFFNGNYTQSPPRVFGTINYTSLELPANQNRAALVIFKDPFQLILPTVTINL